MPEPTSDSLTVTFPEQLYERLIEVSESARRPADELVALAVSEFLKPF
jgi:hypothetical protein